MRMCLGSAELIYCSVLIVLLLLNVAPFYSILSRMFTSLDSSFTVETCQKNRFIPKFNTEQGE